MKTETNQKTQIKIKIPDKYPLTDSLLFEFQHLNSDLNVQIAPENTLIIEETIFNFRDFEYIELKFPFNIFPESNFDELYEINNNEFHFEQPGNHSILFKMGTIYTISIITAIIITGLVNWALQTKSGRVITEDGEYHLKDDKTEESRMADVSFMSYDKASEEEQKKWNGNIPIAPTLSIEIVSAKRGLKPALRKMEEVWMRFGTDIGVVVCPFSKKIYIFEKDVAEYREQSIYIPFTHSLLPDYLGDFSKYVDEI
jgi:Uma2 family endonuclease